MIRSVLIVDDEPADRFIAMRVLQKAGVEADIHELPNGQSALDFVSQLALTQPKAPPRTPSTLALVDINMPRLNGFEFLEKLDAAIRAGDMHPEWIAVMMFTSSNNHRDRTKAENLSIVRGYIVKPLTVDEVHKLMEQHS
jgi:CheY-like chemotaxis protein